MGKQTEIQMIGIVDPDCKVIGIHIYSGLLKIVPLELDSGQELRAIDIRYNCNYEYMLFICIFHVYWCIFNN